MNARPHSQTRLDVADAHWHREVLFGSAVVLVLALLLDVRSDGRVAIRGLSEFPIPRVCASRAGLGINCPACGLTRSLVHLFHGDFQASWRAHRLGWLIGGLALVQLPCRSLALLRHGRSLVTGWIDLWLGYTLVLLLLGNWVLDLAMRGWS